MRRCWAANGRPQRLRWCGGCAQRRGVHLVSARWAIPSERKTSQVVFLAAHQAIVRLDETNLFLLLGLAIAHSRSPAVLRRQMPNPRVIEMSESSTALPDGRHPAWRLTIEKRRRRRLNIPLGTNKYATEAD